VTAGCARSRGERTPASHCTRSRCSLKTAVINRSGTVCSTGGAESSAVRSTGEIPGSSEHPSAAPCRRANYRSPSGIVIINMIADLCKSMVMSMTVSIVMSMAVSMVMVMNKDGPVKVMKHVESREEESCVEKWKRYPGVQVIVIPGWWIIGDHRWTFAVVIVIDYRWFGIFRILRRITFCICTCCIGYYRKIENRRNIP
jgi:hypothetical protein